MELFGFPADYWLPKFFMGLTGLALLVYAILDGYDLGVGILLPFKQPGCEAHRDRMIASIGPFWDANETWLVLAVGLLLIAFPKAHSLVLHALYLPALVLMVGLILRGVAFDFRAKSPTTQKTGWDYTFKAGSLLATLAQGYMIGSYVTEFSTAWSDIAFCLLSAVCVSAGYSFIGAAWLILKTEGELQQRAVTWAYRTLLLMGAGLLTVSVINPLVNPAVMQRWFEFPMSLPVLLVPLLVGWLMFTCWRYLKGYPYPEDKGCWVPFATACGIFTLSLVGLAYSFYPYVVPGEKLTIWEAASDASSLQFLFYGIIVVVPSILLYTFYAYRVFWGKADDLSYS